MGVTIILFLNQSILSVYAQSKELKDIGDITINDPNLKVELVNDEVIAPTSMAFLGPDDFWYWEKMAQLIGLQMVKCSQNHYFN
jgi:hypothetical protein